MPRPYSRPYARYADCFHNWRRLQHRLDIPDAFHISPIRLHCTPCPDRHMIGTNFSTDLDIS